MGFKGQYTQGPLLPAREHLCVYYIAAVQSLVFYELKVVTGAQVENLCNLFHNYFHVPANAQFSFPFGN